MVVEKVLELLNSFNVTYKRFDHEPVITSADASRVRNTDLSMGAKALVFVADSEPIMVVVPGDKRLDANKFKKLYSYKDLYLADAEKLLEVTGLEKGAVPPIGSVFGIKTYMSNDFETKGIIAFNVGSHSISVEMRAEDLIKNIKPIVGDFAK